MRTVSLEEFAADKETLRRLRTARRVVCVIGAGISTTSGIPDFRSAGGLYEHVKKKFNLRNGADLFDANLFRVRREGTDANRPCVCAHPGCCPSGACVTTAG